MLLWGLIVVILYKDDILSGLVDEGRTTLMNRGIISRIMKWGRLYTVEPDKFYDIYRHSIGHTCKGIMVEQ